MSGLRQEGRCLAASRDVVDDRQTIISSAKKDCWLTIINAVFTTPKTTLTIKTTLVIIKTKRQREREGPTLALCGGCNNYGNLKQRKEGYCAVAANALTTSVVLNASVMRISFILRKNNWPFLMLNVACHNGLGVWLLYFKLFFSWFAYGFWIIKRNSGSMRNCQQWQVWLWR